jgi:hypothetical protein
MQRSEGPTVNAFTQQESTVRLQDIGGRSSNAEIALDFLYRLQLLFL